MNLNEWQNNQMKEKYRYAAETFEALFFFFKFLNVDVHSDSDMSQ